MFCYVPALRFSPRPRITWIRRTYFEPTLAYHPTQRTNGRFYDGERSDVTANAIVRFNKHFSAAPGLTRSDVRLPRGAFTATIVSTWATVTLTPNLSVGSLTQWDDASRTVASNARLNYIPKPGADFYVVYTEADQLSARLLPRNRSIIVKLNYILDF